MHKLGLTCLGVGALFVAFAVYHYFQARGDAKAAEAGRHAKMYKIFSVSHGLRGVGSLIMGVALIIGGVVVLAS